MAGLLPCGMQFVAKVLLSFPFAAGVEFGGHSITHERKQKSQALANVRHKDRRALSCLAIAGDNVFPAVLLDRQGFAGQNFLVGIVPSRAGRMGPVDDSVPNYCVAGGTVSL